jgi:formylglycine-generating enzyme required for sulfatase activity
MSKLSEFEFDTLTIDVRGQPYEQKQKSVSCWVENLAQGIELELVPIPAGSFLMGAPKTEVGWHPTQAPQHEVTVAAFWMGKYPVTQAQWAVVATLPAVNQPLVVQPSCFAGETRPIEQVSWQEAIEFCARLSNYTKREYRLPSEAEWEYACRATTSTPFWVGETLTTELANYSGINWEYEGKICSKGSYGLGPLGVDRRETTNVGSFRVANEFGLYDMHGLVREWCSDCWHINYEGAPSTQAAWTVGGDCSQRVLRGGSWNSGPRPCRSAFRSKLAANSRLYDVGFRVVLAEAEVPSSASSNP